MKKSLVKSLAEILKERGERTAVDRSAEADQVHVVAKRLRDSSDERPVRVVRTAASAEEVSKKSRTVREVELIVEKTEAKPVKVAMVEPAGVKGPRIVQEAASQEVPAKTFVQKGAGKVQITTKAKSADFGKGFVKIVDRSNPGAATVDALEQPRKVERAPVKPKDVPVVEKPKFVVEKANLVAGQVASVAAKPQRQLNQGQVAKSKPAEPGANQQQEKAVEKPAAIEQPAANAAAKKSVAEVPGRASAAALVDEESSPVMPRKQWKNQRSGPDLVELWKCQKCQRLVSANLKSCGTCGAFRLRGRCVEEFVV